MQNENGAYEVPAERLLYTHERLKEARDLGEAQVVSTFWGKAKVRVVHEQDNGGWLWALAALCALGAGVAAWWFLDYTGAPEPASLAAPQEQASPQTPPAAATPAPITLVPATAVEVGSAPVAPMPAAPAQAAPAQNAPVPNTPAPKAPAQNAPAPKTSASAQPAIQQPVKSEPAKQTLEKKVPADKPKKPPVAADSAQTAHPRKAEQTGNSPVAVPVPVKPAAPQPVLEITRATNASDKPLPDDVTKAAPPATNSPQAGQTGSQP